MSEDKKPENLVLLIGQDTITKIIAMIYNNTDGDCVARAELIINTKDKDNPVGLLENVWTHPDYRRRGAATDCINRLIEQAKKQGCYKIVLSCSDENMKLYEKLGFTQHQNAMRLNLSSEKE